MKYILQNGLQRNSHHCMIWDQFKGFSAVLGHFPENLRKSSQELTLRSRFIPQMPIDGVPIDQIEFNFSSRHKLTAILIGLQYLYCHARDKLNAILKLIEKDLCKGSKSLRGRKGLSCWENLVLAAIRLGCDFDYDHLADEASHHLQLSLFLGLGTSDNKRYTRSCINDNLNLLESKTIHDINHIVAGCGHEICKDPLKRARGDSFVLKKDIHYPTDSSLIVDGIRKVVEISHNISEICQVSGWRQHEYLKRKAKRILRSLTSNARSKKPDQKTCEKSYYQDLMRLAAVVVQKGQMTIDHALNSMIVKDPVILRAVEEKILWLSYYIRATGYVCDLARRRIIEDEKIPNDEKRFSLFEPDTELINRGKRPVPIEFGHRVLVIEDSAGFILHCQQMGLGFTDEKVVVDVMKELQQRYDNGIKACSWDKGFWTPNNLIELQGIVDIVALPKKGRLSGVDKERENSTEFRWLRKWHSGIESKIHSLVSANGLDRCRDKGPFGYHRYVATAALGRNLITLGRILISKKRNIQRKDSSMLPLVA